MEWRGMATEAQHLTCCIPALHHSPGITHPPSASPSTPPKAPPVTSLPMRPSQAGLAMSPGLVVLLTLVLVAAAPSPSHGKRFDCRMFCRSTGFRGTVGGCRCSFTLFTAKRAVRDQHSVPEETDAALYEAADGHYFSLEDFMRMTREFPANLPLPDARLAYPSGASTNPEVPEMPRNHPARLLVRANASAANQEPSVRFSRSLSQSLLKRREFEQDLDNGDTTDFLRRPY